MKPLLYAPPLQPDLNILHVDSDVIVISKQSGILSVPGRLPALSDCIQSRVRMHFPEATIVHRLDLETSGLMVLARTPDAHRHLSRQFEKRHVEKIYVARVFGTIGADCGTIDAPLLSDWPNRPRQKVDDQQGRQASTSWEVMEREGSATRVKLMPKTGRTHQLRVHMQSLGHPILGDPLYAHLTALNAAERLQLHAHGLSFCHPGREAHIAFTDACPF